MVQNFQYSNGPPNYMSSSFEYRTLILSSIQMNLVFKCLVFRWLLYIINQFYLNDGTLIIFRQVIVEAEREGLEEDSQVWHQHRRL